MAIDENCEIHKRGHGFCWTTSEAWGKTDAELCALCQLKDRQNRQPYLRPADMPRGVLLFGPTPKPELKSPEPPPIQGKPMRTCSVCMCLTRPKGFQSTLGICRKKYCLKEFIRRRLSA